MPNDRLSREDDAFLSRELQKIERDVIKTDYPDMPFAEGKIIPFSRELPPGIETYVYRISNILGMSKIISNNANDLPRVDIDFKEVIGKIVNSGNEFAYTFRDIRSAKVAGRSLSSELMVSSKEASTRLFNETIQYGDTIHGMIGLYNNPNVTEFAVSTVGSGSPNTAWYVAGIATKTPDQIIADVTSFIISIRTVSKGTRRANLILLPLEHHAHLATTPRSANSDTTILGWLEKTNPTVKFMAVEELNITRLTAKGILGPAGGALTGSMMMALTIAKDTIKCHLPMPYKVQPTYQIGLEMITPTEMEFGGVDIRKAYAFAYAKNI